MTSKRTSSEPSIDTLTRSDGGGFEHPLALQPNSVSVEIVRGCNLDCPMCLTERETQKFRRMDRELYKLVIGQLSAMGLKTLRFCGDGEQSLHSLFPEFVSIARRSGFETVGIVTNGTLLSHSLIVRLYEAGLNFIAVSVDAATESTYRKIRRGRHALEEVENNIKNIIQCRETWNWKIEVQLNYVVQPLNIDEVSDFQSKWRPLVDQVNLLRLTSQTASRKAEYGVLEPCYMLRKKLYISVDGDIYPCFYLYQPIEPIGNVRQISVGEAWRVRREKVAADFSAVYTPLCESCTYTHKHWEPGTSVMPHNLQSNAPVNLVSIYKSNSNKML
jgi:radical SAM protein with 4Fe4S-binding SPASM domain